MGWSQIFLKISFEGLDAANIGESETAGYEGQIILSDFDWSMKGKDVVKANKTTRRLKSEALTLTKRFDSSSITLMTAMRERKRIKSARITVAHGFGAEGSELRDTFILDAQDGYIETISLDLVSDNKAMVLQEKISIPYSKLQVDVFNRDANGNFSKTRSTFQAEVDGMDLT